MVTERNFYGSLPRLRLGWLVENGLYNECILKSNSLLPTEECFHSVNAVLLMGKHQEMKVTNEHLRRVRINGPEPGYAAEFYGMLFNIVGLNYTLVFCNWTAMPDFGTYHENGCELLTSL